jgi:hypothetical protein
MIANGKWILCVCALPILQAGAFNTGYPTCQGVSVRGKESRYRIQAELESVGHGQKAGRPPKDFAWKSIAISAVVILAPLSISANTGSVQPSTVQRTNTNILLLVADLEDSAHRSAQQKAHLLSHPKEAPFMTQVMFVAADATGLPADKAEQSLAMKAGLAFFLTYVGVSMLAGIKELVTRIRKFTANTKR